MLALLALVGATAVAALGSKCKAALGSGTAASSAPFWYETITKRGGAPFAEAADYKVFRNVKDYGAVGDGTTDDTEAIQKAIADQGRCGLGCAEDTTTPAVVYFPKGTYLISAPIISYYYTTLLGDARTPPTIKAAANLQHAGTGYNAAFECDPYVPNGGGANYWTNQNNFFRSIRNFNIDMSAMPATTQAIGVHWQVAQATSLQNLNIKLSAASGTQHLGVHMENGSGGFMSDITTEGGLAGFNLGNQQFTFRNLVSKGAVNGIQVNWNWGFTFMGVSVSDCTNAFNIVTGSSKAAQSAGANYIVDSEIEGCTNFINTTTNQDTTLGGSIVIDNVKLTSTPTAVREAGTEILAGGDTTIDLWAQGSIYTPDGERTYKRGPLPAYSKPAGLVDGSGKLFTKSRPQYEDYSVKQFVSVKASGAKGDGKTDDTKALQAVFDQYAGCKIIFVDAGQYVVTDTLRVPVGSIVVGEFFPVILASGAAFQDAKNPKVVVQVGKEGDKGAVQFTSMMVSPTAGSRGAILMEWNVDGEAGDVGLWDTHFRIGGAAGTDINLANCDKNDSPAIGGKCDAAFLGLHVTSKASAYFENMWVWAADHDLEDPDQSQINTYSWRGVLHEAVNPSWYIGTASEHHMLYQYNFHKARNVFLSVPQTESPYFQPTPPPSSLDHSFHADPKSFPKGMTSAWAMTAIASHDILVGTAGFYSFFSSYTKECEDTWSCQTQLVNIGKHSTGIRFYDLSTVDAVAQLSVAKKPIILANDNHDGFQDTATFWESEDSSAAKSHRLRRGTPRTHSARSAAARRHH